MQDSPCHPPGNEQPLSVRQKEHSSGFALSISKSKMSIIRHPGFFTLFVTAESSLPPPGVFVVERDSIAHVILVTSIHPLTEQIALRTDINRVSWLILRFPEVVIIVMSSLNHQETGIRFLIEPGECVRIQLGWVPCMEHILITHF